MSIDLYRERVRRQIVLPGDPLPAADATPAFVGRVTTASPAAGKFVLVNPVTVLGAEGEGNSGSLTVDTGTSVPVLLIGSGVPATGDDLVCRFVGHRWVASKKGVTGVAFCDCPSGVATTLYATITTFSAGNGEGSWTLAWDAATSSFFSTATFTKSGVTYKWRLYCRTESGIPYPTLVWWNTGTSANQQTFVFQFQQPVTGASSNTCSPYYLHDLFHAPTSFGNTATVTA